MLIYKSIKLLLLINITILLMNSGHTGEIYKWTDKEGNVHFGDNPRDNPASIYQIPKGNTSNISSTNKERAEKQKKLLDSFQADHREKKQQREKKTHNANVKKYNCQVAKDDLIGYQRARGIYDRNDVGEKIYLSEKERLLEIQYMKDQVKKWCN
ncbi:MAG: DUF4124 domain-containing protein [Thiohalomonadales bacterium]